VQGISEKRLVPNRTFILWREGKQFAEYNMFKLCQLEFPHVRHPFLLSTKINARRCRACVLIGHREYWKPIIYLFDDNEQASII